MKYLAISKYLDENGEQIEVWDDILASNARDAHDKMASMEPANAVIRVYPDTTTADGLAKGALMVARRTAVNAVKRGGNETQWRMEREFSAIHARCYYAETADRIISVIREYSADVQEFFGYAMQGLIENDWKSIDEQYHAAYLKLNEYIQSQRAATNYELSTEFITDGGGDLVSINSAIASIIRGGEKWTPTDGGEMDAETAARLGETIANAMRIITPTQRHIAELLARGYSQRQIAEQTKRGLATVNRNIAIMRDKITDYVRDNAPEFMQLVKTAETAAAAHTSNIDNAGRTAAAQERKAAKNAEYCKAYRARKAAERKAAKIKEAEKKMLASMENDLSNCVGNCVDRAKNGDKFAAAFLDATFN